MKKTYVKPASQFIKLPEEELFATSTFYSLGKSLRDLNNNDYDDYNGPSIRSGSWTGSDGSGYFD